MKSKERLIVVQMIILGLVTLALSSYGSPDAEGQSLENLRENTKQWVNEIQLSGTFRLGGKDFASLVTPEGNFWVEEGKFASGYKLIELDVSKSQPSALIQKGDQQAWIGLRLGMPVPVIREVLYEDLEERERVKYVKGETKLFTGTAIQYCKLVPGGVKFIRPAIDGDEAWKRLETPYVDGRRQGMHIVYRKDGSKQRELPYMNGKIEGKVITYREDGSKWMEQEFVNDKVDGMFVEFREDGSKKSEVRRVNYKKVGTEVWFSEDGSVLKEVVYEKGKKITETEY
ncbi:hypothetical protein OAV71_04200 [Opitutales bacterium]|nr:hypothetical protein [Opitutales bacterium]